MCTLAVAEHRGLVTLLEILQVFAELYVEAAYMLGSFAWRCQQAGSAPLEDFSLAMLKISLEKLRTECERAELVLTREQIDRTLFQLPLSTPASALAPRLVELQSRLHDELKNKVLLQLHSSRTKQFGLPTQGWERIVERLPESLIDVEEAGRCFALSRYAACVFHSTQIVEHGLIDLGTFIGVQDPKSGWTAVTSTLRNIVQKDPRQRTQFEADNFPFLEQVQGTAEALKNAWRNKINHAGGRLVLMSSEFVPDVAEEILVATRAFMRRLAEGLPPR